MKIEKIRVRNFKVFHDMEIRDLAKFCVFLGANGVGKSTLFDIFGFLSDALNGNVRTALNKRGGFKEVYSRNGEGPIEFEIKFRNDAVGEAKPPLITYELHINLKNNLPIITKEILSYRRGNHGRPYRFLEFAEGTGSAILNEEGFETEKQKFKEEREIQTLASADILAIKGLGQFQKFKAIASFRKLLESWYVSNFKVDAAQTVEDSAYSEHLSVSGNNLAQVTKYIYETHPDIFNRILDKLKNRIPGIEEVHALETPDGRIVLQFKDGSFKDPFISRFVSDGTIKMFAYLILLNDPQPHPLLCVEEPENYLHPELLPELAEEFREYANKGGQVLVSTHSPELVNALDIKEVFWLHKQNGYTTIQAAQNDEVIKALYDNGDKLGWLWYQGYFKGSGPKSF